MLSCSALPVAVYWFHGKELFSQKMEFFRLIRFVSPRLAYGYQQMSVSKGEAGKQEDGNRETVPILAKSDALS